MDTMVHLLTKFQSRLAAAIDADDTSLVLDSITDIPVVPFMAILDDSKDVAECVWVTGVTTLTKTLAITRAQRGTTAVAHVAEVLFYHSEIALADLGFFEVWETPGETGRPLESQLITNVLLGGWANGMKGYVDCDESGGSIGLLSGVNGEIRLPNSAGRGAYFALEGEVVLQELSTITPWGSSAGFLYLGASGHADGLADFNADGRFMVIMGLTPAAGHLLSLDYHTLKCTLDLTLDKYLVLSLAENMISHNFSALANNGRMMVLQGTWATPSTPDGQGLLYVDVTITGLAVRADLSSMWANLGAAAEIPGYLDLRNDGIWDAGATLTTAVICMQKYSCILASDPRILTLWNLNMASAFDVLDALFEINSKAGIGYIAGGATDGGGVGTIPLTCINGADKLYIHVYSDRT